jgi:hypothetical protein
MLLAKLPVSNLRRVLVVEVVMVLVGLLAWGMGLGMIGFPVVSPIGADCFGIKSEWVDELGIWRVSCYGIMYNVWLEN